MNFYNIFHVTQYVPNFIISTGNQHKKKKPVRRSAFFSIQSLGSLVCIFHSQQFTQFGLITSPVLTDKWLLHRTLWV